MKELKFIILALILFNTFLLLKTNASRGDSALYFLDVGQGDSTLLSADGVKIITDAGPTKKVTESVAKIASKNKYIDIAIITHPQTDHFNGFNYLLDEYDFGAFVINGRSSDSREWADLMEKIKTKNIPLLIVGEGDSITYKDLEIRIISPNKQALQSGEPNDTGIVQLIKSGGITTLLTADIGFDVENYLLKKYGNQLDVDLLKVAHHGSKYSSEEDFLKLVSPKAALVGVGEKNRYGHPTKETLKKLGDVNSQILRTDKDGNIKILSANNSLEIYTYKD